VKLRVRPVRKLAGRITVPGDKSVSHRAALFGALAEGTTEIDGYLESEDCLGTLAAVQALGADVTRKGPGQYRVTGAGLRGLQEPGDVVDCGNSGTTARLLLGILAGQEFWTFVTGDESLRRRPMARVAEPLRRMGATLVGRAGGAKLPLAVRGAASLRSLRYELPVASAQVKSAVLLAGLYADGAVTVSEPAPSRDHTERMLRLFGARVETANTTVTVSPGELRGASVRVPGDISSAAFPLVASLIVPEARVTVTGVGANPTRTGLLDVLAAMGAAITCDSDDESDGGEPTASLTVEPGPLRATTIAGALVPRLIDEIPVLAVAALAADGVTEVRDAAELRVKESDRIAVLARELGKMGARIAERPDGFAVTGPTRLRGARVTSGGDHRVAMALAVAALAAEAESVVDDVTCIATSFPGFAQMLNALAGEECVSVVA
jgi:3-phosphoshikimate 1-carboxyvinyltransferase